jgi:hypothetical protein
MSRTFAAHRPADVRCCAVDRADIVEAEFLEQRAAGDRSRANAPRALDGASMPAILAVSAWPRFAHLPDSPSRTRAREIGAHRADRRRDRHVVVVEDDDQPRIIAPALFIAS